MKQPFYGNLHLLEKANDSHTLLLDNSGRQIGQSKKAGHCSKNTIGTFNEPDLLEPNLHSGLELRLSEEVRSKAILNGKVEYNGWSQRIDGSRFFGRIAIIALYDEDANLVGFCRNTRKLSGNVFLPSKSKDTQVNKKEPEHGDLFALINNTEDLMWSVDRNYKLITSNKSFDGIIHQMIGSTIAPGDDVLVEGFSEEQLIKYKELYQRAFSGETFKVTEYTQLPVEVWSDLSFHPIHSGDEVIAIACHSHDVTDQKKAEKKIIHTQRLYAFISQINQTISHSKDEKKLFNDACHIAIEIGKFGLAWIGMPALENRKLNIVAHLNATAGDFDYINNHIYDDHGPTANVLKSSNPYVINDFSQEPESSTSRKFAAERGFKSLVVLPVKKSSVTIGTFNLFSKQPNLFDREEMRLLIEAASDISFALDVFEKDKHRKIIEDKIASSELRLKQAQAIAHNGSWEYDLRSGLVDWS